MPVRVEFVLTTADAVAPLRRVRIEGPLNAGIHAVSLREENVVLDDGVEYQWSIAIVHDPERRSRDVVAIGTLERVAASSTPDGAEAVFALAERRPVDRALQRVEELIAQSNDDARLRRYRRVIAGSGRTRAGGAIRAQHTGKLTRRFDQSQLLISTYGDQ